LHRLRFAGVTDSQPCRFAYAILTATEVSVLSQTFQFEFPVEYLQIHNYPEIPLRWGFGFDISPAVWATFALFLMLLINVLPVRIYGEVRMVHDPHKRAMLTKIGRICLWLHQAHHDGRHDNVQHRHQRRQCEQRALSSFLYVSKAILVLQQRDSNQPPSFLRQ